MNKILFSIKENYINIVLGFLFLTYLIISFVGILSHDELETIHSSWLMNQNLTIYKDFFEQHHSPFYWFISILFNFLPHQSISVIVLKVFCYFLFLVICFLLTRLYKEIVGPGYCYALLIFMLNVHVIDTATDIRTDIPMIIFQLLGLIYLFRFLKTNNNKHLFSSSLCLSASLIILQKSITFSFGIGLMMIYILISKKIKLTDFVKYWIVFFIPITIMLIYYLAQGRLEEYIFYNWIINLNWENNVSPLIQGRRWFEINNFSIFLFITSIYLILKTKDKRMYFIAFLSMYLALSIFLYHFSFQQYWLPFHLINSILCGYSLNYIFDKLKIVKNTILLFLIFYPSIYIARECTRTNFKQIEKINYVLSNTDVDDLVYDGDIRFNLFRKDIDFYYFSVRKVGGGLVTERNIRGYEYNIYESISEKKPKIISSYMIDNLNHPTIKNNYIKSEKFDDLYLLKN